MTLLSPLTSRARPAALALCALALCAVPRGASADAPRARVADPIALSAPQTFAAAVEAVEKATGARAEALAAPKEKGKQPSPDGRSFALDARTADRLLAGSHAAFRAAGFYLFRYERGFGLPGEHDHLGLLATSDRDAVLRRMGTGGSARTEALVAWLREVEAETPFDLLEIGVDYVAGRFTRAPRDPVAMARRTTAIAPALLSGGDRELALLAEEIRANRTLYLIW